MYNLAGRNSALIIQTVSDLSNLSKQVIILSNDYQCLSTKWTSTIVSLQIWEKTLVPSTTKYKGLLKMID